MSRSKTAPKGVSQSEWNKVRAIYALIDHNIIQSDPGMGSYTDAPSYGSNGKKRAKAAREFVSAYRKAYPKIFGRGKAFEKIYSYLQKTKGRVNIKAQVQALQQEGDIELPDYRFSAYQTQTQGLSASDEAMLSGGIFEYVSKPERDPFGLKQAAFSDANLAYPFALGSDESNVAKFKSLLPTDVESGDRTRIKYQTLGDLLSESWGAGPTRVLLEGYANSIRAQAPRLISRLTYAGGDEVSSRLTNQIEDVFMMAQGLWNGLQQQNAVSGTDSIIANLPDLENRSNKVPVSATAATIAGLNAAGSKNELVTGLRICQALVTGKLGDKSFQSVAMQVKRTLIGKQMNQLFSMRDAVAEGNLLTLEVVGGQLRDIFIEAKGLQASGAVEPKAYNRIIKNWKELKKVADKLPSVRQLMSYVHDGNLRKIRDAKYQSQLILQGTTNLMLEIERATKAKETIKGLKDQGTTQKQIVSWLSTLNRALSPVINIGADEVSKNAGAKRVMLGQNPMSLVELRNAQGAARTVQRVLGAAKRESDKGAISLWAYLMTDLVWKVAANNAYEVSKLRVEADMSKVVNAQISGFAQIQTGKYQGEQVLHFGLCSTGPEMFGLQQTLTAFDQNYLNAVSMVRRDLPDSCISSYQIPPVDVTVQNPNQIKLPSAVQSMTDLQAQARAQASSEYLQLMWNNYGSCAMTAKSLMGGGGYSQSAVDSLDRQVKVFAAQCKNAKIDKTMLNTHLPKAKMSHGLYYTGFTPRNNMNFNTPILAILSPEDLLFYRIFRGDTLVSGAERRSQYPMAGSLSSDKFSLQGEEAYDSSTDPAKYPLMRRVTRTPFGKEEAINWSPLQAAGLRHRYFVSLYPFSLQDKTYNQIYNAKLNILKGKLPTAGPAAIADVLSKLGIGIPII